MRLNPRKDLPDPYTRFWSFDLSRVRELFWLNLIGLVLVFASMLGFAFLLYWLRPGSFSLPSFHVRVPPLQFLLFLLEIFAVMLVMVVVHESFHGLFFWIFTGSRPKFAFKIYYASAAAPDWYIPRRQYFVIGLAPLVGITFLGILGLMYLPVWLLFPTYLLLVFNTSGAVGDMWVMCRLLFCPSDTWIKDSGDSIEFFRA